MSDIDKDVLDVVRVKDLVQELGCASRRRRQEVAHLIAEAAKADPACVVPFGDELVDALSRPEAQTRWEALGALAELAGVDAAKAEAGFDGAEEALFDDDSALVRLAAFVFLCRLGATSPERSDRCWPLIDEAVQCYHGDAEYRDMLQALAVFAQGSLSEGTARSLAERVRFDAKNGTGFTKAYSQEIVSALQG